MSFVRSPQDNYIALIRQKIQWMQSKLGQLAPAPAESYAAPVDHQRLLDPTALANLTPSQIQYIQNNAQSNPKFQEILLALQQQQQQQRNGCI